MSTSPHAANFQPPKASTERSIRNRLLSIRSDALAVSRVVKTLHDPRPAVVANERCGSWYVHPEIKTGAAYFKSTDGHEGEWAFSTRRLNLGLLDILGEHGLYVLFTRLMGRDGELKLYRCVIVDSTRGRSMSDALSKTIPIWCAIMNRLLFPDLPLHHELRIDIACVAESEQYGIEARLDTFLATAKVGSSLCSQALY
jgi:tRNA A64-2'-O-ribosylphosphate transferase